MCAAGDAAADLPLAERSQFEKFTELLTTLFPVWVRSAGLQDDLPHRLPATRVQHQRHMSCLWASHYLLNLDEESAPVAWTCAQPGTRPLCRPSTSGMPAQVCLGAALGISKPSALLWFKSDLFTYALGFLMLSMGLTLTFDDFRQARPRLPAQSGWEHPLEVLRHLVCVPCCRSQTALLSKF